MEQHIQCYTKRICEDLAGLDIDTATYKEHLHKSFEWFACIELSKLYNSIFRCWEDIQPQLREEKGMMRDMGIDAWDIDGNRLSQMKLYSGCISWRHFATFLACSDVFENPLKILYRNTESTVCDMIQHRIVKKIITDINVSDTQFRSECKRIQQLQFPSIKTTETFTIRPYQKEAIRYLEKGKDDTKNVYLGMPTGCGKTTIVLEYHIHNREERFIVLVPRVVLMEQWGEECDKRGIRSYLIGTGKHHNLDQYRDENIVICVYDSFPNIYEQKEQFQRFCIDEAHHIKLPERYMDNDLEHQIVYDSEDYDSDDYDSEDLDEEKESLSYMKCIQSLSDTNRVIYLSATLDQPDDDSYFFEYKVRQAIDEGYLCDYQFVCPIFGQEYVTNEHLANYLVNKQHESHCVIYASNCKDGKEFTSFLNIFRPGCAGYIDAYTPYKERQRLFKEFESGQIQFLVNIRLIVEGFNAPHIRSIFFLKVSSSEIFIIQAIGRALRQHIDKQIATIYVPFTHESDLEKIQMFISQLASYDERVKKSIDEKKIGGYFSMECGEMNEDKEDKEEEEKIFDFRYNLVVDSMGDIVGMSLEARSLKNYERFETIYNKFGIPRHILIGKRKQHNHTHEEIEIQFTASWYSTMKNAKKNGGKSFGGSILYKSVETKLEQLIGIDWFKTVDFEKNNLIILQELFKWQTKPENIDKKPRCGSNMKKKLEEYKYNDEAKFANFLSKHSIKKKYMLLSDIYIKWKLKNPDRIPKKLTISEINKSDENFDENEAYLFTQQKKQSLIYPSVEKKLVELYNEYWYNNSIQNDMDRMFQLEKKYKDKKPTGNDPLALWIGNMRYDRHIIIPDIRKRMTNLYPDWLIKRDENYLENEALKLAKLCVDYFPKNEPRHLISINNPDKEREHRLAEWISQMKKCIRGKKTERVCFDSVKQILDKLYPNWLGFKKKPQNNKCCYIIRTGNKKGKMCGYSCNELGLCNAHLKVNNITCSYTLTTGKNKSSLCGRNCPNVGIPLCNQHSKAKDKIVCNFILIVGVNKGKQCGKYKCKHKKS